jgi:hypothetical protein
LDRGLLQCESEGSCMRYFAAWLLGVPFSVIVLWYLVAHSGC